MKSITIILIFFLLTNLSFIQTQNGYKAPLAIVYKNTPDSLQDFLKVYFQTKKLEVINREQVMPLLQEAIMTEGLALINSGKLNQQTADNFSKNMLPVCNVLSMILYNDTTYTETSLIDSIRWRVDVMPVKDTTNRTLNTFMPKPENKSNPYIVLKSFADMVLQSKTLK